VAARSPSTKRAPAAPVRERSAHRSTPVVHRARPQARKYDQKTPKKMIRLALYSASRTARASSASRSSIASSPGASQDQDGRLDALDARHRRQGPGGHHPRRHRRNQSFRNLDYVKTIDAGELNAYDVLDADWILFTDATLPIAKEHS